MRLTYNGQTVRAMVLLASSNGESLMLGFGATLRAPSGGIFAGSMPLLRQGSTWRDIVEHEPATVEPEQ